MPVVINDFEAVAEAPSAQGSGAAASASPPAAKVDAAALRLPLRRLARRHDRVKAH